MAAKYLKQVKLTMEKSHLGIEPFIPACSKDCIAPIKEIIGSNIDVFEVFGVIFLNQRDKSIGWMQISTGGINSSIVDMRILMSAALNCLATTMIVFHNHPSGHLKPSQQDINITKKIKDACEIMYINLMDHIIVSEEGHYSFAENGIL